MTRNWYVVVNSEPRATTKKCVHAPPKLPESVGRRRNPNPLPLPLFFFFKELENTNLFTKTFYLGAALGPWAAFLAHYLPVFGRACEQMEQKSCNILIYTSNRVLPHSKLPSLLPRGRLRKRSTQEFRGCVHCALHCNTQHRIEPSFCFNLHAEHPPVKAIYSESRLLALPADRWGGALRALDAAAAPAASSGVGIAKGGGRCAVERMERIASTVAGTHGTERLVVHWWLLGRCVAA